MRAGRRILPAHGYRFRLSQREYAEQYQALLDVSESIAANRDLSSLCRDLAQRAGRTDLRCPGRRGGAAEPVVFHDWAHVLSGYGTTPEEEVQVACFSAGFQRRDPFLFVFFVLVQFHVGFRMTPITAARTGFFDPAKALIAIRRGAAMNVDLNDAWDYWPVMVEQVEEL